MQTTSVKYHKFRLKNVDSSKSILVILGVCWQVVVVVVVLVFPV